MRSCPGSSGNSTKTTLLPLLAVALTLAMFSASALAASSPSSGSSGPNGGPGFSAGQDLIWAASGILAMDKTPTLRVTPAQAGKIAAIFKRLEGKRLITTDPTRAGQGGDIQVSGQGQSRGGVQGQNGFPNMSAAQREEMRHRRVQREQEIQAAVDEIDKILTPKQVEFIDNIDFDPAPYSMRPPGSTGGQGGQMTFSGGMPSQQQIQELRKRSQAVRERMAKLYKDTLTYLEKRAQSKK